MKTYQCRGALMKGLLIVATVLLCGCASSEHISLMAGPSQQSMTRDGIPALLSTERQIVMLRPVQSSVRRGDRPAFIVAVYNRGRNPTNLLVSDISATGNLGTVIHVFGYDELVAEARRKQRWATFAVALAGAAGAMNAANAGYTHTYGTYSGYSHGTYSGALNGSYTGTTTGIYSATTYDPARAYAAQSINNAQTAANLAAIQARGEQTLGELQNTILKDNTVMPGEWVGGVVVLDTPEKAPDGIAQYKINVEFGGEVHSFSVSQARTG
jgi:hypothetical protein